MDYAQQQQAQHGEHQQQPFVEQPQFQQASFQQEVVVVHAVGKQICDDQPLFPRQRKFQDVIFGVVFLALVVGLAVIGASNMSKASDATSQISINSDVPKVWCASLLTATAAAIGFVLMLRLMPVMMVWFCLLITPAVLIVAGLYTLSAPTEGVNVLAYALLLAGVCNLCVAMCYRHFVPMTAEVLTVVAHVLLHHLGMLAIGMFAGTLHMVWVFVVGAAWMAVQSAQQGNAGNDEAFTPTDLFIFFACSWGLVTIRNLAYLSYCSVFGQWYFGERVTTMGSFGIACTKSFGSVCFGSLVVALVKTFKAVAQQARRSDNGVAKIVGLVMQCLLQCIEDMVEWFNSFAYVQVAIRGCSFCDAARATVHLCTWANCSKLIAQILSGSVTFMGALIAGLIGVGGGFVYAQYVLGDFTSGLDPNTPEGQAMVADYYIAFCGALVFGIFGALNVMTVIEAGINTTLVCWAERPHQLALTHPEIHTKFMGHSGRTMPPQQQPGLC